MKKQNKKNKSLTMPYFICLIASVLVSLLLDYLITRFISPLIGNQLTFDLGALGSVSFYVLLPYILIPLIFTLLFFGRLKAVEKPDVIGLRRFQKAKFSQTSHHHKRCSEKNTNRDYRK